MPTSICLFCDLDYRIRVSNFPKKNLDVSPLDVARGYIDWRDDGQNRGAIVRASFAGCMRDGRPLGIVSGPWCAAFVGLCDFEAHAEHTWRAAVHELVGWICRSGLTQEDRVRTEVAQRHSLRELARVMFDG